MIEYARSGKRDAPTAKKSHAPPCVTIPSRRTAGSKRALVRLDAGNRCRRRAHKRREALHHDLSEAGRRRLDVELERVGRGDRRAFEELYRLSSAKLFAVCLRILPRRQEAEDALQDAYLTIWRRASRFDAARGSAIAWLTVITRNTAIDRLRARGAVAHAAGGGEDVADPAPAADIDMIAREDERRLFDGLDGLDPIDAAFLRTAFLGGATYADLAERERLPLGTVKSRIRRALLKLRERLA